ncbi:FGGY family carbohydrate kinase, partial [Rhizobium sp. BR5]
MRAILSIDQGTTNSKAILVSESGELLARGSSPVGIAYPQPGWVEQEPKRIWASV